MSLPVLLDSLKIWSIFSCALSFETCALLERRSVSHANRSTSMDVLEWTRPVVPLNEANFDEYLFQQNPVLKLRESAMRYPTKEFLLSTALLCAPGLTGHAQAPTPTLTPRTVSNFVPVTNQAMRAPKPEDWLIHRGNYQAWGYSPLRSEE